MKPISFFLFCLIVCATTTRAQIPNNGFEIWSTSGSCMQPQGWACINDWLGDTQNCYSMSRSDDHYPATIGSYSIKIENTPSIFPDLGAAGLVWTGDSTGFGTDQPAFRVLGHPTSLRGYYKFLPENGDTMDIHFAFYKNGVEVTGGRFISKDATTNWTSFKIQVSDPGYPEVDSARIMLASFNPDGEIIYGHSVLYVDNLSFDSLVSAIDEIVADNSLFSLYPNPALHNVCLKFNRAITDDLLLEIYSQSGVRVQSILINKQLQEINISGLNPGVYLMIAKGKSTICAQKLIIIR